MGNNWHTRNGRRYANGSKLVLTRPPRRGAIKRIEGLTDGVADVRVIGGRSGGTATPPHSALDIAGNVIDVGFLWVSKLLVKSPLVLRLIISRSVVAVIGNGANCNGTRRRRRRRSCSMKLCCGARRTELVGVNSCRTEPQDRIFRGPRRRLLEVVGF